MITDQLEAGFPSNDLLGSPDNIAESKWVVMKFGGTSVSDAENWSTIANLVRNRLADGLQPLVVHSALKGVSNTLERLLQQAMSADPASTLLALQHQHYELTDMLKLDGHDILDHSFAELKQLITDISELKEFEDKVLSARERALARELFLYQDVLEKVADELAELQRTANAIAELDVVCCLAERAESLRLTKPEMSDKPCIEIEGGRHLVVEQVIETAFVANDLTLDDAQRLLVITGPNMGGKSTYMRQTALIAILAFIGSYVPADRLRIGPIDRIFTRIGASDDLAGGRSTFMVEMTETATILNNASEESLVLMDEIGRGTSTFDGLSLAWAAAHYMGEKVRAFTLFATHYFELTALAEELPACSNVHLDATEHDGQLVFLHAVRPGPANQSYGLQVAALAGVPPHVIQRAQAYLKTLESLQAAHGDHPQAQLALDIVDAEPDVLRDTIDALQPDSMTPRDALEALYKLKDL